MNRFHPGKALEKRINFRKDLNGRHKRQEANYEGVDGSLKRIGRI